MGPHSSQRQSWAHNPQLPHTAKLYKSHSLTPLLTPQTQKKHTMFRSSSAQYNDPAFYCSAGPPPLTGSLDPYTAASLYDATAATTAALPSSLPSNNYFMHRSCSTHSFTHSVPDPAPNPFFSSSSPPSSVSDFLDFHHEPVRRVYSTGDLQASTDNCVQDGSATVGRVGRYTAEERMKKIERYRSKRNQRNFHKKITYACRKTLADSRPRVRGRFARNGEPEAETEQELEPEAAETSYGSYTNNRGNRETSYESYTCNRHGNQEASVSYNNFGGGGNAGDRWWKIPATTLATTDEEEEFSYSGEDLWASFDGVFSMNLLS